MSESFLKDRVSLHCGDCLEVLAKLPENSVDACVTDPPYHLVSVYKRFANEARNDATVGNGAYGRHAKGFMGKQWDGGDIAFRPDTWAAVYRVLKPGAHLLACGGTRTYHRLACAIEDAGFEVRDCVLWLYGSGFPKSHDVSKGIDKAARGFPQGGPDPTSPNHGKFKGGCSEENPSGRGFGAGPGQFMREPGEKIGREIIDAARQWQGWGTALKPAVEMIVLARKPLSEGTVAANVLRWRTGAINVDKCRVPTDDALGGGGEKAETAGQFTNDGWRRPWMDDPIASEAFAAKVRANVERAEKLGRWPANVIHDGSEEVVAGFPMVGDSHDPRNEGSIRKNQIFGVDNRPRSLHEGFTDRGSAARFFYTAKADSDDRLGSKHPTVKPLDLMQYLCRLVTPPKGTVLDPFAGTGTTGEAAWREGFSAVLIEREEEYQADICRRMALALAGPDERVRESIRARGQTESPGPLFDALSS